MESKETIISEGMLELCIDKEHITIPVERFQELLKTETELAIVRRTYEAAESYSLQDALSYVLGPRKTKTQDVIPVAKLQELLKGDSDA